MVIFVSLFFFSSFHAGMEKREMNLAQDIVKVCQAAALMRVIIKIVWKYQPYYAQKIHHLFSFLLSAKVMTCYTEETGWFLQNCVQSCDGMCFLNNNK